VLCHHKILVAQSEPAVAVGVRRLLEQAHAKVILASSGKEALNLILVTRPDLVLIDLDLDGDLDGIATAQRIPSRCAAAVVYLGRAPDDYTLSRVAVTTPSGFVFSPIEPRQLLTTVRLALSRRQAEIESAERMERCFQDGLRRISMAVLETEAQAREEHQRSPEPAVSAFAFDRSALANLSRREWDILRRLLANGRAPAIAQALYISPHTVRNHLKAIFRKLGVSSQAELLQLMQGFPTETLH
jgi:DNA-binding NarL/FixJ family response regulator